MQGRLFTYHPEKRLSAFKSGCLAASKAIVFVGGLGDGFLALPLMDRLNIACEQHGYCLIQTLLSSSYSAFGVASLESDAEELGVLLEHIAEHDRITEIHLLGHSTGCQDILWLFRSRGRPAHVRSVILQGPVSDADYIRFAFKDLVDGHLEAAKKLPKDALMPFRLFGCPISAYRFVSLAEYGGDDDMFSHGCAQKKDIINGLPVDCLVVMCGKDQYATPLASPLQLLDEFQARHSIFLPEADHAITAECQQMEFITGLFAFLADIKC